MTDSKYALHPFLMNDDDDQENKEKPEPMGSFMMKKMEQLFFEKRSVYLWGVVDDKSAANTDANNNKMTVLHTAGQVYTDILVTCLLDYGEPPGQQAFDNSTNFNGEFVFDELGLKTWNGSATDLRLITHVIFHPVQKSLNRQIQIDYTLRIQTLTNLSAA
jgi:hypothetical protein